MFVYPRTDAGGLARRHEFSGCVSQHFRRKITEQFLRMFRYKGIAKIQVNFPDVSARCFCDIAKPRLTLFYRGLRPLECRNILQDYRHADDIPVVILDGGMAGQHIDQAAILGHAIRLMDDDFAAQQFFTVVFLVGRPAWRNCKVARFSNGLSGAVAEHSFRARIPR